MRTSHASPSACEHFPSLTTLRSRCRPHSDATYTWMLRHSALGPKDGLLLGASSLAQIDQNLAACELAASSELPPALASAFDSVWTSQALREAAFPYWRSYSAGKPCGTRSLTARHTGASRPMRGAPGLAGCPTLPTPPTPLLPPRYTHPAPPASRPVSCDACVCACAHACVHVYACVCVHAHSRSTPWLASQL